MSKNRDGKQRYDKSRWLPGNRHVFMDTGTNTRFPIRKQSVIAGYIIESHRTECKKRKCWAGVQLARAPSLPTSLFPSFPLPPSLRLSPGLSSRLRHTHYPAGVLTSDVTHSCDIYQGHDKHQTHLLFLLRALRVFIKSLTKTFRRLNTLILPQQNDQRDGKADGTSWGWQRAR